MKYKLLTIADKDLIITLEREAKLGFEWAFTLEKVSPNSQSDFVGWRMIFKKVK